LIENPDRELQRVIQFKTGDMTGVYFESKNAGLRECVETTEFFEDLVSL
jgi:hypothetical protein